MTSNSSHSEQAYGMASNLNEDNPTPDNPNSGNTQKPARSLFPPGGFGGPPSWAKPAALPPSPPSSTEAPPSAAAPSNPWPAAPSAPPVKGSFAEVLQKLQAGEAGSQAAANNLAALKLLIASGMDVRTVSGNAPDNRLREALINPDPAARAAGNYGIAMRLLMTGNEKLRKKALEHLIAAAQLAEDPQLPPDVRKQLLAVTQLTAGLIKGEDCPIDYFLPGLQAPDRGTRAAANLNAGNRLFKIDPPAAVKHYLEAIKLTGNPATKQKAIQWLSELGYDQHGKPVVR
jgi:hypothetical protein